MITITITIAALVALAALDLVDLLPRGRRIVAVDRYLCGRTAGEWTCTIGQRGSAVVTARLLSRAERGFIQSLDAPQTLSQPRTGVSQANATHQPRETHDSRPVALRPPMPLTMSRLDLRHGFSDRYSELMLTLWAAHVDDWTPEHVERLGLCLDAATATAERLGGDIAEAQGAVLDLEDQQAEAWATVDEIEDLIAWGETCVSLNAIAADRAAQ